MNFVLFIVASNPYLHAQYGLCLGVSGAFDLNISRRAAAIITFGPARL